MIMRHRRIHFSSSAWSPNDLASPPLLFAESTDLGDAGTLIDSWTNRGTAGSITAAGTARPTVDAATFGAKVASFDGTTDAMTIPSLDVSIAFTAYVLLRRFSASDTMWGLVQRMQSFMPLQLSSGVTICGTSVDLFSYPNPASVGWNLCCFQWTGSGTPEYRVDTALQTGSYAGTGGASAENRLGARVGTSQYGKGYIAFALFCQSNHTSGERALVEAYVKSKFPTLVQY